MNGVDNIIKVKDCRTCPMAKGGGVSGRTWDYRCYILNERANWEPLPAVLKLTTEELIDQTKTFLPEQCPLLINGVFVQLENESYKLSNQVKSNEG